MNSSSISMNHFSLVSTGQTKKPLFLNKKSKRRTRESLVPKQQKMNSKPSEYKSIGYANTQTETSILYSPISYMKSPKNIEMSYIKHMTEEEIDIKYNPLDNANSTNTLTRNSRTNYMTTWSVLDPSKRRMLVDWIMEVCTLLHFKRETFHCSVNLMDIYLSKLTTLSIGNYQLIGVSCLFLTSKQLEMFFPNAQLFARTTDYAYISHDIWTCEKEILKTLKWRLHYCSLNYWIEYLTQLWDDHIEKKTNSSANTNQTPKTISSNREYTKFPSFTQVTYLKKIAYVISDLILFDYFNIIKDFKIISISIIYWIIGLSSNYFTINDINSKFTDTENDIDKYKKLNIYYNHFWKEELNVDFTVMDKYISYVSLFFDERVCDIIHGIHDNGDGYLSQDYSVQKKMIMEDIEKKRNYLNN